MEWVLPETSGQKPKELPDRPSVMACMVAYHSKLVLFMQQTLKAAERISIEPDPDSFGLFDGLATKAAETTVFMFEYFPGKQKMKELLCPSSHCERRVTEVAEDSE